jgi:hypothetical protein
MFSLTLDTDSLTGKDLTEVDLSAVEADAATARPAKVRTLDIEGQSVRCVETDHGRRT